MAKIRKKTGRTQSCDNGGEGKPRRARAAKPPRYAHGRHPNSAAHYFKPGNKQGGRTPQSRPSFMKQVKQAMRVLDEDGYTTQQRLVGTLLLGAEGGNKEFMKLLLARIAPETRKHDVNAGLAIARVGADELEERIMGMIETGDDE